MELTTSLSTQSVAIPYLYRTGIHPVLVISNQLINAEIFVISRYIISPPP